ncbi:MAG: hypothetical protein ACI9U2_000718 [Bradymonadia bacterium]|jgi:hypothetical protein
MSRFDDRDHAVEQGAALTALEQDAPGLEIGGAAAVAQAAELMEAPDPATIREAPAVALMARPAVQPATQAEAIAPSAAIMETAQPVVTLAPDGGGGGGTLQRGGGASQVHAPGPNAAADASMQLRAAEALQQQALLEEPAARTPFALRRKKKKKKPAEPAAQAVEPESDQS